MPNREHDSAEMLKEHYLLLIKKADASYLDRYELKQMTVKQLEAFVLLLKHNIPLEEYGQGKAKSIAELLEEVAKGEAVIRFDAEKGDIYRETKVIRVRVYHTDETGTTYQLIEEMQIFENGEQRIRTQEDGNSYDFLSEKASFDGVETDEEAAKRAILEELQQGRSRVVDTLEENEVTFTGLRYQERTSSSYPGLKSRYNLVDFSTDLTAEQYDPAGYIEVQPGKKTTYFKWEQIQIESN